MVDLRNDNYKLVRKILEYLSFYKLEQPELNSNTNVDSLFFFDKYYFDYNQLKNADMEVDKKIYNLENNIDVGNDDYILDDFEIKNIISEVDVIYNYKDYFKDVIYK